MIARTISRARVSSSGSTHTLCSPLAPANELKCNRFSFRRLGESEPKKAQRSLAAEIVAATVGPKLQEFAQRRDLEFRTF